MTLLFMSMNIDLTVLMQFRWLPSPFICENAEMNFEREFAASCHSGRQGQRAHRRACWALCCWLREPRGQGRGPGRGRARGWVRAGSGLVSAGLSTSSSLAWLELSGVVIEMRRFMAGTCSWRVTLVPFWH